MKFVQVGKLVGLFCLCLGAALTGAQNLRPRSLPFCAFYGEECNNKTDCCDEYNCVGMWNGDKLKRCYPPGYGWINHCISEGKQCDNGGRPHQCCPNFDCIQEGLGDKAKSYCIAD